MNLAKLLQCPLAVVMAMPAYEVELWVAHLSEPEPEQVSDEAAINSIFGEHAD